jgi:DNA-binding MarR family transcriptional regulator
MTADQKDEPIGRDSVSEELAAWMDQLPGVDPQIEAASERMRRIARLLGRLLAHTAAQHEMTVGDWESLSVLQRAGLPHECSPKELAEKLGVTSGTMSVRIERLTQAGLVEPGTARVDGRSRPIRLTTRGRELWRAATEQRTAHERRLLAGTLSTDELEQLDLLLGKLLTRFEGEFGPAPSHGSLRREAG